VSLYYPLTPVQKLCPDCQGFGKVYGQGGVNEFCKTCDAIGRVFIDGGPSFGCKTTLAQCKPGQIVTLGNGDRGRIVQHNKRGSPTTEINLIDPMFDEESRSSTTYPSETGVASMSASSWHQDPHHGGQRAREDHLDPLQQGRKAP